MKTTRLISRSTRTLLQRTSFRPTAQTSRLLTPTTYTLPRAHQNFSTTPSIHKGLQPDTSDPKPPNPESNSQSVTPSQPTSLSDSEYHEIADQYLNDLQLKLEERAERPEDGFDVEFSAGVLTLKTPKGTYVLNKQPPNKQIWLSSPVSGPKRYDWVVVGDGQGAKEGTGTETEVGDDGKAGGGKWVYLRDGTALSELLKKEVEVDVAGSQEADAIAGKEGPGGSGAAI